MPTWKLYTLSQSAGTLIVTANTETFEYNFTEPNQTTQDILYQIVYEDENQCKAFKNITIKGKSSCTCEDFTWDTQEEEKTINVPLAGNSYTIKITGTTQCKKQDLKVKWYNIMHDAPEEIYQMPLWISNFTITEESNVITVSFGTTQNGTTERKVMLAFEANGQTCRKYKIIQEGSQTVINKTVRFKATPILLNPKSGESAYFASMEFKVYLKHKTNGSKLYLTTGQDIEWINEPCAGGSKWIDSWEKDITLYTVIDDDISNYNFVVESADHFVLKTKGTGIGGCGDDVVILQKNNQQQYHESDYNLSQMIMVGSSGSPILMNNNKCEAPLENANSIRDTIELYLKGKYVNN